MHYGSSPHHFHSNVGTNPYGMSWYRRWNENGVDLNRNALTPEEFEEFKNTPNQAYMQYDEFLNPSKRVKFYDKATFLMHAGYKIFRDGFDNIKQAVAGGQYVRPGGLFFGGTE